MFEKKGQHEADITPKEHSPENHCYYNTYHFTDDLTTITEAQVHQKLVDTIQNVESWGGCGVTRVVPRSQRQSDDFACSNVVFRKRTESRRSVYSSLAAWKGVRCRTTFLLNLWSWFLYRRCRLVRSFVPLFLCLLNKQQMKWNRNKKTR